MFRALDDGRLHTGALKCTAAFPGEATLRRQWCRLESKLTNFCPSARPPCAPPQMCQKALSDYMESKRRAFPRFYFVSSADLLDILSNGNNPIKAGFS